ncbi:MAG: AzlD domain-containing protein [Rhodospirillaceae bacterium]|nr:AzlD domain-containing protein [Rhodospirillaceae bacterium]
MAELQFPTWALPWVAIFLGAAATYASRLLGVLLSGRVAAESRIIEWITCVTYALLAGLVARMIVLPIGSLNEVAPWARLLAAMIGLGVFFAFKRNIAAGVSAGTLTLIALIW